MNHFFLLLSFTCLQDTAIPPFDTFHESEGFANELKTYAKEGEWRRFKKLLEEFYQAHAEKVVPYKNSYITAPDWLAINILQSGKRALEQYRLEYDHLFEKEFRDLMGRGEIHRCLHLIYKYILCAKAPELSLKTSNILLERGEVILSARILNKLFQLDLFEDGLKAISRERVDSLIKTPREEKRHPMTLLPTKMKESDPLENDESYSLDRLRKLPLLTERYSLELSNTLGQRKDLFALTYFNQKESLLIHNNGSSVIVVDFESVRSERRRPNESAATALKIKTYYAEHPRATSASKAELPFFLGGVLQNGTLVFNRIHRITIRNNTYMSEALSCYAVAKARPALTAHLKWDLTENLPPDLAQSRLSFIPPYIIDDGALYTIMVAGKPRRWMHIDQYDIYALSIDLSTGNIKWKRMLERQRIDSRGTPGIIRSRSLPSIIQIDKTIYAYTPSRTLFSLSVEGDILDIVTLYPIEEHREHLQREFSPQLKWSANGTNFYIVSPGDENIFRIDLLDLSVKKVFTNVLKFKSIIKCDSSAVIFSDTSFSLGLQGPVTSYTDDFLKISTRFALDDKGGLFACIRPGHLRAAPTQEEEGYATASANSLMIIDATSLKVVATAPLGRITQPLNISIQQGHIILSSAEKLLILRPASLRELNEVIFNMLNKAHPLYQATGTK